MNILYGTGNPAKWQAMQGMLAGLDITLLSLRDMPAPPPEVPEGGASPLENARIKALAYYEYYRAPVFSCDSGLYFDNVTEDEQPGVHVRMMGGRRLTDEEVIAHYAALARAHGGRLTARYRNGICLVLDNAHRYESMDAALAGNPFLLTDTPHPARTPGFPLDSLSIQLSSGRYYNDLPTARLGSSSGKRIAFQRFFSDALGDFTQTRRA